MHHWHWRWLCFGRVFVCERYLLAQEAFWLAIVTTKHDSWRWLCFEIFWPDLWSLYKKLSHKKDYSVVNTMEIDGYALLVDTKKTSAPVFFPPLPR